MSNNRTPAMCGQAMCGQTVCGDLNTYHILHSISVTTPPTKTIYNSGEAFNASGMIVTATYDDGATRPVIGYTNSSISGSAFVSVVISYTEGGITKSTEQTVYIRQQNDSYSASSQTTKDALKHTNSLNRAGVGIVDLHNKNVTFVHNDVSIDHPSMPLNISHIFNTAYWENLSENNNNNTYCGNGWRTSYHQYVYSYFSEENRATHYYYIDGNGNKRNIVLIRNNNYYYALEDDLSTTFDSSTKTLLFRDNSRLVFNSDGWLENCYDPNNNVVTITNSNGKITNIKDAQGDNITFTYSSNRLSQISASSNKKIENQHFSYDSNGNLTAISYGSASSAVKTHFGYDNLNKKIDEVIDPIGHKLNYFYNGAGLKIWETTGANKVKYSGEAEYSDYKMRKWQIDMRNGTATIIRNGKRVVYGFDAKGQLLNSYEDGKLTNGANKLDVKESLYVSNTLTNTIKYKSKYINSMSISASLDKSMYNYAADGTFENSISRWASNSSNIVSRTTDCFVTGTKSLQLTGNPNENAQITTMTSYTVPSTAKGFIVSCFAKGNSATIESNPNESERFSLYARLNNASNRMVDECEWHFDNTITDWQAGAACLENDGTGVKIYIELRYHLNIGTVNFDNLRIVEGTFVRTMNTHLSNGSGYEARTTEGKGTITTNTYSFHLPVYLHTSTGYIDEHNKSFSENYTYQRTYNRKLFSTLSEQNISTTSYYNDAMYGMSSGHVIENSNRSITISDRKNITKIGSNLKVSEKTNDYTLTNLTSGLVEQYCDNMGNIINYSYDSRGMIASMQTTIESNALINTYYFTKYLLTRVISGNKTIDYIYDGFGELSEVKMNNATIKKYSQKDNCDYFSATDVNDYNYDEQIVVAGTDALYAQKIYYNVDGLPLKKYEKNDSGEYSELVTVGYLATGQLNFTVDNSAGFTITNSYDYNNNGSVRRASYGYGGAESGNIDMTYTTAGNPKTKSIYYGNDNDIIQYTYTPSTDRYAPRGAYNVSYTNANGYNTYSVSTAYDTIGRAGNRTYTYRYAVLLDYYNYTSDNKKISSVRHTYSGTNSGTTNITESYGYDANDYISSYTDIKGNTHDYQYDKLGRLKRENDPAVGVTKIYEYENGNIKAVKRYPYTTGTPNSADESVHTYNCYTGTDKLKSITLADGRVLDTFGETYDNYGNPLQWRENMLKWERGKRLVRYGSTTYNYDAGGVRRRKTVDDVTHTYYTEGATIFREVRGSKNLKYYYDDNGIEGISTGITQYHFVKNLFGDIVQIVADSGTIVASYVYDAWGNHRVYLNNTNIVIYDSLLGYGLSEFADHIGVVNPWRYRGYYWDEDTKLYYLQTRYYDPYVGRFLNADSVDYADPESFNGLNLYTYAGNNPVMYTDGTGQFAVSIFLGSILIGALIGGVVGGGFEIGRQLIFEGGVNDWGKVGLAALGGAAAGALTAIPIPGTGFLSWAGTFALGAAGSLASGAITGAVDFSNPWSVALAVGIGGFANVAARGISNAILSSKASAIFNQGNKAKSLAVQQLQGHARNMGSAGLKGSMRNAFKNTSLATIKGLITNANPFIRYGIYASINSAAMSTFPYIFF